MAKELNYLMMSEPMKLRWRKSVYTVLRHNWIQDVGEEEFHGTLKQYIELKLTEFEMHQKYEACAGLRDLLDEYSTEMG